MRFLSLVVLSAVMIAGCAATRPSPSPDSRIVVESSELLDVAPLNARLASAAAASSEWAKSPLLITLELFGGDAETRSVSINEEKNRGEGADSTIVTLIRDGLLDDSTRGFWVQIRFHRLPDDTWRLHEARRAKRCWRGERMTTYGAKPCP